MNHSIEPYMRRDHISFKTLKDTRVKKKENYWELFWWLMALVFVLSVFVEPYLYPAKAETIDENVSGQSDRIQEATYCAQILVEGKEVSGVPSMKALVDHCHRFGV